MKFVSDRGSTPLGSTRSSFLLGPCYKRDTLIQHAIPFGTGIRSWVREALSQNYTEATVMFDTENMVKKPGYMNLGWCTTYVGTCPHCGATVRKDHNRYNCEHCGQTLKWPYGLDD